MAQSTHIESSHSFQAAQASPGLERAGLILAGVFSWFIYFPIQHLLDVKGSVAFSTPLDAAIPFKPWAEWIYALAYPFGFLPAFQIRHVGTLRRYVSAFVLMQLFACAMFVLLPLRIARPVGVDPTHSFAEWALALNYALDPLPMKCFPSLHVANALYAALVAAWLDKRVGWLALPVAVAIAASTVLTKQHYAADVLGGALLAYAAFQGAFATFRPGRGEPLTWPRRYLAAVPALYGVLVLGAWLLRASGR